MTPTTLNCDRVDVVLADYLEGELDRATRLQVEAHMGACVRCTGIVRGIAAVRHEASQLPELMPSRDLWEGIAARIETPVSELPREAATVIPMPQRSRRPVWLGVAAAALVAVTTGVTYGVMRLAGDDAVGSPADQSSSGTPAGTVAGAVPSAPKGSGEVKLVSTEAATAAMTYDQEINRLRTVLDLRREDLDPATVAVLSSSLSTIDRAIADARAALANDSASRFLNDQLNKALQKKLGILRTVALLPPRAS